MKPQSSTIFFGFDSAWTDAPKSPGAICAIAFDDRGRAHFHEPQLVSFAGALTLIEELRNQFSVSIVALDQPTVVPNETGSRPVDKVAASLISFVGGGVQPANRGKIGMFCDNAPIWPFLNALDAIEDPMLARTAHSGHFIVEVFPALALAALEDRFAQRLCAPKYNPKNRRKFRLDDWRAVARVIQRVADCFGVTGMADWAHQIEQIERPRKADQDMIDAALCSLVGLAWRAGPSSKSAMLGDLISGYMITPLSDATRPRLEQAALRSGVSVSPVT